MILKNDDGINVILVLNYNDYKTTCEFIENIKNYKAIDLILIVDNKSSDNSFVYLSELINDKVKLISTKENKGYSNGNNYGLQYLIKNYNVKNVIISNPDIEVCETTIKRMFNYLDNNDNAAAVSGKIYDTDGHLVENFAWKLPTFGTLLVSTFLSIYKISKSIFKYSYYYEQSDYNKGVDFKVDVISGCFFAIKMKCMINVGLFDEETFLFGEENILFYKLKESGYKNYVLMDEKIIHHHGISINKNIKNEIKKENILFRSNMIYLQNYLEIGKLKKIIYTLFFFIGKYEKQLINRIRNRRQVI